MSTGPARGANGSGAPVSIFRFLDGVRAALPNRRCRTSAPDGRTSADKARRARGETRPYSTVGLDANETDSAARKHGGAAFDIGLRSEDCEAAAIDQSTAGLTGSGLDDAANRTVIFDGSEKPGT